MFLFESSGEPQIEIEFVFGTCCSCRLKSQQLLGVSAVTQFYRDIQDKMLFLPAKNKKDRQVV